MANFDFSNLNLNPREVEEISKVIFEQVFTNPALEKMHRILDDITTAQSNQSRIIDGASI